MKSTLTGKNYQVGGTRQPAWLWQHVNSNNILESYNLSWKKIMNPKYFLVPCKYHSRK